MFARGKRLSRAMFPTVLKNGQHLSSAHFSIVFSQEGRGYAVVVPKKVARLSVTRHRIKRQVLAILQSLKENLPSALIVFPKASVGSVSYQGIKTELATLLSRKHHT